MKQLLFISFMFLLFCISCKKVEEIPQYKIQLKTNQRFTVNSSKTWRDTIFYTIVGATQENYRFVFHEQKQKNDNINDAYENISQSIKIVQQTPTYLIYEIPYSITSNFTFQNVSLYLTVNTEVIDIVNLPIKDINDNTAPTSGTLIYLQANNKIIEYDFSTRQKKNLYTAVYSDIDELKLSSNKKYLIFKQGAYIVYSNSNGVVINKIQQGSTNLGFLANYEVFYAYSDEIYAFLDIENSNVSYLYNKIDNLKQFLPIKNDNYYNVDYYYSYYDYSNKYQIRKNNNITYYSSFSEITDLAINPAETTLLFVENGNKLQSMNLATKQVTTLYTISSGSIQNPTFNDDGTKIALSIYSNSTHQSDIYTMDNTGKNIKNITNTSAIDEDYPNWK